MTLEILSELTVSSENYFYLRVMLKFILTFLDPLSQLQLSIDLILKR